jgi:hypothetical protein
MIIEDVIMMIISIVVVVVVRIEIVIVVHLGVIMTQVVQANITNRIILNEVQH